MGTVDGCAAFAKYLLIAFNILFFLVGAALLGVGLWILYGPYTIDILAVLDNNIIQTGVYCIIALGAFILVIGFLGCAGALCEIRLLLALYFIVVLIIFLVQIAVCASVIAFTDTVEGFITDELNATMNDYVSVDSKDIYSVGWNAIQLVLECCGTNGYEDWADTAWTGTEKYEIQGVNVTIPFPVTCCAVDDPYAIVSGKYPTPLNITACFGYGASIPNEYLNQVGCYKSLENYIVDQAIYVGGVGIGLAAFEIFCMIFAICVCRGISKAADVI